MEQQLYIKQLHGKRVSYSPYQPELTDRDLTDQQLLTMVGSLGVVIMHNYQRLIPEHKRNHRAVAKVESAILEMLKGTGKAIDDDMAQYTFDCWNLAVAIMARGAVNG